METRSKRIILNEKGIWEINREYFYTSKRWRRIRKRVFVKFNGLCENCKNNNKIIPADVVHHIEPLSVENIKNDYFAYDTDNLIALCHMCHSATHSDLKGYSLDYYNSRSKVRKIGEQKKDKRFMNQDLDFNEHGEVILKNKRKGN